LPYVLLNNYSGGKFIKEFELILYSNEVTDIAAFDSLLQNSGCFIKSKIPVSVSNGQLGVNETLTIVIPSIVAIIGVFNAWIANRGTDLKLKNKNGEELEIKSRTGHLTDEFKDIISKFLMED